MAALAPLLLAAVCVPALLAFNEPPSPTALNQAAAIAGWGGVLVAAAAGAGPARAAISRAGVLLAALALVAAAAFLSSTLGSLPWALGGSALGLLAATMVLAAGGASLRAPLPLLTAFHAAWVVAGLASALVALVQVFAPQWADGTWIARSGLAGRAVGNLRQPNHLCQPAAVGAGRGWCRCTRLPRLVARALAPWRAGCRLLVLFAWMLSALAHRRCSAWRCWQLWGLLDRRLSARGAPGAVAGHAAAVRLCWVDGLVECAVSGAVPGRRRALWRRRRWRGQPECPAASRSGAMRCC
jgi:hypothetical protein